MYQDEIFLGCEFNTNEIENFLWIFIDSWINCNKINTWGYFIKKIESLFQKKIFSMVIFVNFDLPFNIITIISRVIILI